MIQRKQTVFLALAAVLAGLMYAFPLVEYDRVDHQRFSLKLWGLFLVDGTPVPDVTFNFPLHLIIGILGALLVVCIFLFKNRQRQMRLVRMGAIFALMAQAAVMFTHTSIRAYLAQGSSVDYAFSPTFFLPLGILTLAILAQRGIRKDEELVKSMDRLR
jgi:cytochrome bd-type quinol oxidase subunit 2